eukprot:scaffold20310_cov125-Isochrysis_galbana.AAC.2
MSAGSGPAPLGQGCQDATIEQASMAGRNPAAVVDTRMVSTRSRQPCCDRWRPESSPLPVHVLRAQRLPSVAAEQKRRATRLEAGRDHVASIPVGRILAILRRSSRPCPAASPSSEAPSPPLSSPCV